MMSPHESLTLQLLEWVADKPRTHAELMARRGAYHELLV